jgi:TolA-binding protein
MRFTIILALLAATASAAPPTTCGSGDEYGQALCAYQKRDFRAAEAGFRAIVQRGEEQPETIRATYFLGRTLMKQGRFSEASDLFIRIYDLDRTFYNEWNVDFLLGECRRALGKG